MIPSDIPTLILFAAIVGALLLSVLVALDARRSRQKKTLRKHILEYVSVHTAQSYSVIVESEQPQIELFDPFLEHLMAQDYSKLQVITLVESAANIQAINALRKLQRRYRGRLSIRVIKRKTEVPQSKLLRRYATGDVYVWLDVRDTLSKDFFKRVSMEFINPEVDVVSPRTYLKVSDSLTSASHAILAIWRSSIRLIAGKTGPNRMIMRRDAYVSERTKKAATLEQASIMSTHTAELALKELIAIFILAAFTAGGVALSVIAPYQWVPITAIMIVASALVPFVRLFTYSYPFWTKLSLLLIVPVWPILMTMVFVLPKLFTRKDQVIRVRHVARTY